MTPAERAALRELVAKASSEPGQTVDLPEIDGAGWRDPK